MRALDFSSWQAIVSTLLGIIVVSLVAAGGGRGGAARVGVGDAALHHGDVIDTDEGQPSSASR